PIELISDWKYLARNSKLRIIVDEGLNTIEDYFKYADFVDGVNIKMAKSGGLFDAVKIARRVRKDKLKILLGCMVESSIGIAPAVYMADLADYFDLDGPLLLQNDIGEHINFNLDEISVDDNIIGGPKIRNEFLDV
ncbi:MAG: enolase C-terminal domain-like protein, partial [Candidatus Zixiibacteriota bacterium]